MKYGVRTPVDADDVGIVDLGEWLSRSGRYRGDDKVMRNGKLFGN